ncbi:AAA family ATPase [Erythrobacter rubeus]|uniref:AAA family ATPase n=1 Tax=Erythrobacter rubeus TaxID=2760803 RepID=UPI002E2DE95D|nr:AAA family ATPase [Erythrobacter rubeus]
MTGFSSGGKTTLLGVLARRGHTVIEEPGLRVIRADGPKPWDNLDGFITAALELAQSDLEAARESENLTFFDRGVFDALSGLASRRRVDLKELLPQPFPYSEPVFYVPPWPEIYEKTEDRQLPIEAALEEAATLKRDLEQLGIAHVEVPKVPPEQRTDFVLSVLGKQGG